MAVLGDTRATSLIVSGTSTLASINANSTGLGTNGQILKSTGTGIAWVDAGGTHNHDSVYVNVSGDTMTGALNFANNIYNKMGDDAQIGDQNQAGRIAIKGINGNTGIYFAPYSGSTAQSFTIDGAGTATLTGSLSTTNLTLTNTTDATSSTEAGMKTAGGLAVAKKIWLGSGLGASSTNNNSSHLIISSSDTGAGGNVALELWRGTNASWQIGNEGGNLHFRTNYTTAKQTTYSVDAVNIAYNTGNTTIKGTVTAPTFIGALTGHASSDLALSGGTMTGDITFTATTFGTNPTDSKGLVWSGGSDGAKIFYRQTANNAGSLVLQVTDDGEEYINFRHTGGGQVFLKPNTRELYPDTNNTGSLGTSTYKWANIYGGALTLARTTAGTNTYADANPKIIFQNGDASQNASLTFTEYDSVIAPASLTLNGNNGNEWFITPNLKVTRAIKQLLTGTGTAATTSGSNYVPAKWTFNTGLNASDGDIFTIKIPVAGHDYGVFMSVNNGTNYYPVVISGTGRVTTHYPVNTYIQVVFEASGSAASMFPVAGGTSRVTVSGGVFRVLNYYDSGNSGLYQNYNPKAFKIGATATTAYDLLAEDATGLIVPAHKVAHRVGSPIYIASSAKAANATGTWWDMYQRHYSMLIRKDGTNLSTTAYNPIYLKGTIANGMFTPDTTTPYVFTKAGCNVTGAYYMFVGDAQTSASYINYNDSHPYYYYDGSNLLLYTEYATVASKLATARSLKVALGSTTAVTFDGSAAQDSIPVSGTLKVANGGTGATTFTSGNVLVGAGTNAITTIAKTNANTANTLVQRDGSGNFSAGTITANLNGNASTATQLASSGTTSQFWRGDNTWAPLTFMGCDYANVVETYDTGLTAAGATHTIGNDGWLRITTTNAHRTFKIDDLEIPRDADTKNLYPVKAGQVFTSVSYYGFGNANDGKMVYTIYGVKH